MKSILALLFCMCYCFSNAQLTLERQVISPFAINISDGLELNSTGGQVDFIMLENNDAVITSGFEQPNGILSLSIQLQVEYNACSGLYDAVVETVTGCETSDEIIFIWNSLPGDSAAQSLPANTSLVVESSGGCIYQGQFDFSQMGVNNIPCDLEFFSFLSPNGDGDNDEWNIRNIDKPEYADNEIQIMNRWGNVVWKATGYNNINVVWKGCNMTGDELPDGTYFYHIKVMDKDYDGYIELMR